MADAPPIDWRNLGWVALALGVLVAAIVIDDAWLLNFVHVMAGVLWTGKRPRLPDDAMRLNLRIENAQFSTFGKLPPISNASGNVVVSGSTVGIDLEKGEIKVPSGTVSVDAESERTATTEPRTTVPRISALRMFPDMKRHYPT